MSTTAPQLLLPPVSSSARTARHWVSCRLRDLGRTGLEDLVLLLTSEVVTNAVVHAMTRAVVSVERSGPGVRVEVHDGSSEPPVCRAPSASALHGRGVALLDSLADGWGWEPDTHPRSGKTVWFQVLRGRVPHDDAGSAEGPTSEPAR